MQTSPGVLISRCTYSQAYLLPSVLISIYVFSIRCTYFECRNYQVYLFPSAGILGCRNLWVQEFLSAGIPECRNSECRNSWVQELSEFLLVQKSQEPPCRCMRECAVMSFWPRMMQNIRVYKGFSDFEGPSWTIRSGRRGNWGHVSRCGAESADITRCTYFQVYLLPGVLISRCTYYQVYLFLSAGIIRCTYFWVQELSGVLISECRNSWVQKS